MGCWQSRFFALPNHGGFVRVLCFLAGIAGSAAIYLRRRRIQGTKRLLIESAVAGFVLGFSVLQKHTDTDKEFTMN